MRGRAGGPGRRTHRHLSGACPRCALPLGTGSEGRHLSGCRPMKPENPSLQSLAVSLTLSHLISCSSIERVSQAKILLYAPYSVRADQEACVSLDSLDVRVKF